MRGADQHTDEGGAAAGLCVIDEAGGQDEGAAHREVGEVADEGRRRALQEQLDQHLDQLRRHAGDRPEIKGADHDRKLAEVDLIEGRGEGQRDLEEHQYARHAGEHRRIGDVVRAGQGLGIAAEQLLQQPGDEHEPREDRKTGENEAQVFHGGSSLKSQLGQRKTPEGFLRAYMTKYAFRHVPKASSLIRTVPSVPGFHRFVPFFEKGLRTVTAGQDFHLASKIETVYHRA